MSDKEKALIEKISKLPDNLQERFLYQAQGAVMALDSMNAPAEKVTEEEERSET